MRMQWLIWIACERTLPALSRSLARSGRMASTSHLSPPPCRGLPMSPSGAEHHLLLGLFALQFHLVTREQLLAAASAWLADRDRSLGAILLDQGALAAENLAWLEALTRRHLEMTP